MATSNNYFLSGLRLINTNKGKVYFTARRRRRWWWWRWWCRWQNSL